jgi:hypothetical protein
VKKVRKVVKKAKKFKGIVLEVLDVVPTEDSGSSQVTLFLLDRKSGGGGFFRTAPHYVYGLCDEGLRAAKFFQGKKYKLIPLREKK